MINGQIDYSRKHVYKMLNKKPVFQYAKITIHTQDACDLINAKFNINFNINVEEKADLQLSKDIHQYLQDNKFIGIFGFDVDFK